MGGQLGPSPKEEWVNKVVCGLSELEQSISERQLSVAQYGPYIAEGGRIFMNVYDGWIF